MNNSRELNRQITATLETQRGLTKRKSNELFFSCFHPERHTNGDKNPSARWNEGKGVWCCDVCNDGGGAIEMAKRLGLADETSQIPKAKPSGLTVAKLAEVKHIPVEVLAKYDIADCSYYDTPAIQIPYLNPDGSLFRNRYRLALEGPKHEQFLWDNQKGKGSLLYGLNQLDKMKRAGYVLLVEGESDCWTAWYHRIPALGLPGKTNWNSTWATFVTGLTVYIWQEPDAEDIVPRVATDIPSLMVIRAPEGVKDISEAHISGKDIRQLTDDLKQGAIPAAELLRSTSTPGINRGLSLVPLSDLLAEPEENVSWLWDLTLPSGGTSIVAAKPKVGKSTLARNLALKVAQGEPFLGRGTTQGAVVYLALEEKRGEVANHFQRMGADSEPIFIHVGRAPKDSLTEVENAINTEHPLLVIVDPLLRMVRMRNVNEYSEATLALEPWHALARTSGAHIMFVHHTGKGDREGGDAILGSTALYAAVDTALIMKPREGGRTIESTQRYGEDIEKTVLNFDSEGGIIDAAGTVEVHEMKRARDDILEFLTDNRTDEKSIQGAISGSTALIRKALRELVDEGKVSRDGAGHKGDPYQYENILVSRFDYIGEQQKREKQENENPFVRVPDDDVVEV